MIKSFYIFTGTVSLGFAFAGVVLPVLPTTPFVLLSMFLFDRSDPKYREWILNHKVLGPYVRDYVSREGIPLVAKIKALLVLWISIIISTVFFITNLYVRIVVLTAASLVTIYILTRKTRQVVK
jgi:uncharacterized protein